MARRWCLNVLAALIPAVLFITGCGTTPYERADSEADEGYSDSQLQPDVFRVNFRGDEDTPKGRAYDFVLLRAAEVTREHNFSYFAIMKSGNPAAANTYYNAAQAYDFYVFNKPLMIRCFTAKPDGTDAFDSAFLEKSLKEKYHIATRH
ncbi:MAG: hypothetical protein ABSD58_18700 [Verrucomicrobiia bacterium]|jgi:hypothetical protein